jgi:hypothetical protein
MSERLEVRIDPGTMELLKEVSEKRGVSVGELVRRAVSTYLADEDRAARMAAVEVLCSLEVFEVGDWEAMEEEYERERYEELP